MRDLPSKVSSLLRRLSSALFASQARLLSMMALLMFTKRPVEASSGGRISGSVSGGQSSFSSPPIRERSTHSESPQRYTSRSIRSESSRVSRRTMAIIEHSPRSGYENRAVLSEGQSYVFLLALLATAASRPLGALVSQIRKRSSFYKFQLLFSFNGKELKAVLDHISATSAAYAKGVIELTSVIEELCLLALRNQDSLVGAHIAHRRFLRGESSFEMKASAMLEQESIRERAKYERETTGGTVVQSMQTCTDEGNTFRTYFVLTLCLASKGPLFRVNDHRTTPIAEGSKPKEIVLPLSGDAFVSLQLTQSILYALPAYLKSLTTSAGSGYKADIVWTPDRCDESDRIGDSQLNSQWPLIKKF